MIHGAAWRAAYCCVKFDIKHLLCYSWVLVWKPRGKEYAMCNFCSMERQWGEWAECSLQLLSLFEGATVWWWNTNQPPVVMCWAETKKVQSTAIAFIRNWLFKCIDTFTYITCDQLYSFFPLWLTLHPDTYTQFYIMFKSRIWDEWLANWLFYCWVYYYD